MRLLIAGSRTLSPSITDIDEAVASLRGDLYPSMIAHAISFASVISGGARGVDAAGEVWAHARICGPTCARRVASQRSPLPRVLPLCSAVEQHLADWRRFQLAAGMIRNEAMARACDAAVVFWDGESPGTRGMIDKLEHRGKPHRVVQIGGRR